MASTILVNTINTQSGSTITIPTGKTLAVTDAGALTIGGTAITTGSSNIQRKTADYTIVTGDVVAKSELIITCNAAGANRTITLPATNVAGISTCVVTILCDADATSTFKLMVVQIDGSTEVWTGYEKGDFVRLIVSNSVWVVVDHKETYYSRFFLAANQTIATSAGAQLTGWTENEDIGNMWVNGDNEIVTPASMTGFIDVSFMSAKNSTYSGTNPALKLNDSYIANWDGGGYGTDQAMMQTGMCGGIYPVTSAAELEFWGHNNDSDTTKAFAGGTLEKTHFTVTFTRTF